ncbi:reverse transcriptase [Cucumis melo var. makuwa]|uniref:Reverse transcriptase n=1 Tax=Cucumis melo var. makuwa TaxID=1194695 RepID=A0A5A7TWR6_CUCMM|nr:reverse transcriptase [Cucumis melo var. makuwa]
MDLCKEIVWDTPNDNTQYAKLEEVDRVYDFLTRLNPKFDTICDRILGQRPLPSLIEVCFEVCLEEDRTNAMGVLTTPTINSAAFNARSSNHDSDKNNGKSIPVCEHCKKQWHTKDQCWKLHDRPPGALLNQLVLLRAKPRLRLRVPLLSHDMSSGRTIGTARHNRKLYILDDDTSCSSLSRAQVCVFVGYPVHQRGYKCFHPPSRKYFITMDVTFCENRPYFSVSHLQGRVSDVAVLENMEEKNCGDETNVRIETSNNEAEQGHTRKLDEYDPSLDILITLRKGTKSFIKHPICNYYDNLSPQFRAFTASLDSTIILKNIYTALKCPEWKNAVMEEMKALEKNRTWEIYILPKGHKIVGCKWVFSLKYKADGTLNRHKTRFTTFVKSQGYSQGHSDHTLFTKVSKTWKIAILIVYLDDIILTGNNQTEISQLKQRMDDEFEINNLRNLKYFLGMEVARSKEGISMSQRKYTLNLLIEIGMLGCRPADTPIKFNCKLENSDDQVSVDKEQYQCLAPYEKHMEAVKRILRYSKNTHAAISIANNPIQHDRTKHVKIDRHFIKERLDSGSICIPYIPSSQQVTDVLTKELPRPHFDLCVTKLGLIDFYVPT